MIPTAIVAGILKLMGISLSLKVTAAIAISWDVCSTTAVVAYIAYRKWKASQQSKYPDLET